MNKKQLHSLFNEMRDTLLSDKIQNHYKENYAIYSGEHTASSIGIAVPANLDVKIKSKTDWGRTAVDRLCNQIKFDAFYPPEYGLTRHLVETQSDTTLRSAIKNSMISSCAFIMSRPGNKDKGEAPIVRTVYNSAQATGIYSAITNRLKYGLVIESYTNVGDFVSPATFLLFAPGEIYRLNAEGVVMGMEKYKTDRVLLTPFIFKADASSKPFGESRYTPGMIESLNAALRMLTLVQLCVEVYGIPHHALIASINGGDGQLDGDLIQSAIGNITKIIDSTGMGKIDLKTISSESPKPILDAYDFFATQFASHASMTEVNFGVQPANGSFSEGGMIKLDQPFVELAADLRDAYSKSIRDMVSVEYEILTDTRNENISKLQVSWVEKKFSIDSLGLAGDGISKLTAVGEGLLSDRDLLEIKKHIGINARPSLMEETNPLTYKNTELFVDAPIVSEEGEILDENIK